MFIYRLSSLHSQARLKHLKSRAAQYILIVIFVHDLYQILMTL